MELTAEQLKIIQHGEGHARVSAVAGSGKTTTMIGRIGHLLRNGVQAEELLVLMFNRSARDGFVLSMEKQLKDCASLPEIRTFHSLGYRLVASFVKRGVLPSYTLVTEEYVFEKMAKQVAAQLYRRENGGHISGEDEEEFLTFIDQVKATVEPAGKVFDLLHFPDRLRYFIEAFAFFEQVRQERRIRFYNDLIYEPLQALRDDPLLVKWVENRVDHIIVDEYQDINEVQQHLLLLLAGQRAQVMVVGDVDQCIYEWRGARPDFIVKRFHRDFPGPVNYTLSRTFRFGHRLSLAANYLIHNNILRDEKLCISDTTTPDTQISYMEENGGKHPILAVVDRWRGQGRSLEEIAVLVRMYAHSVPLELALLDAGIPYRLEGHERVFDCGEIVALLGYLQLSLGILGTESEEKKFRTVVAMLSQPHLGVRQRELEQLARQVAQNPLAGADVIEAAVNDTMPSFIQKRFFNAAENWRWIKKSFSDSRTDLVLRGIVEKIDLYSFYSKFSVRNTTAENRIKTCEVFIDFAGKQGMAPEQFLRKIEELRFPDGATDRKSLLITSIHRAKGLEWPLVVIPGLEDGSFPLFQDMSAGESLEDERRLFYVAMTRAVEEVVFIYPRDRLLRKAMKTGRSRCPGEQIQASRFLYEARLSFSDKLGGAVSRRTGEAENIVLQGDESGIAARYLRAMNISFTVGPGMPDDSESSGKTDKPARSSQADENPDCDNTTLSRRFSDKKILQIDEIAEGLAVWHEKFGCGTVTAVKDRKQGRLQVLFADHGEVILLARYAGLRSG
ncbi:ATP-dependent helicase [Desulfomarina sp.]